MSNNKNSCVVTFLRSVAKLTLMATLISPGFMVKAQSSTKTKAVYPSFGIGIGFFYPKDVNDYIKFDIEQMNATESVNTHLYMYLEIKGGVTFRMKSFDVTAGIEYDVAPKYVMVVGGGGDDFTYFYNRLSPEVSANFYFPAGSGKHAFFMGGGVNYSFLSFEGFKSSAPGFKAQLGYSMQFGKFNMQPYGAFRYTKAKDKGFDLTYTGGQIGLVFSFHPPMSYK